MALTKNALLKTAVAQAAEVATYEVSKELFRITGDGVDGQTNKIFQDTSPIARTLSLNGVVHQSASTPYYPNWSYFFDGSTNYLSYPAQTNYSPNGSDDFCVEAFVYPTHTDTAQIRIIASNRPSTGTAYGMSFLLGPANNCYLAITAWNSSGLVNLSLTSGTNLVELNKWSHVAAVRESGVWKLYINGTMVGEGAQNGAIANGAAMVIGKDPTVTTRNFFGHISCVRIQRGTIPYTGKFSPSKQKLAVDANTVFLGVSSASMNDESALNQRAAVTGSAGMAAVSNFTPFDTPANDSYQSYGGSMYTVVGTNYVSAATSTDFDPGAGDFTISAWVKTITVDTTNGKSILTNRLATPTGGWQLSTGTASNRILQFYAWNSSGAQVIGITSGAITVQYGTWNHVAVTKQGSTWRIFLNGALVGSGTQTAAPGAGNLLRIAHSPVNVNHTWVGSIADVNIVKGVALWTAAFTPPTIPLDSTPETVLQAKFTNAGIYDSKRNLSFVTNGNARISGSVLKKGAGSMQFTGSATSDYVMSEGSYLADLFRTEGSVTVRMWFRLNALGGSPHLFSFGTSETYRIAMYVRSTNKLCVFLKSTSTNGAIILEAPDALLSNTWYHVALTRASTTWKLWLNGALVATAVSSIAPVGAMPLYLGVQPWTPLASDYLNGYIDDFVVTKDKVEFTTSFDPNNL